jgi:hypothetical protein
MNKQHHWELLSVYRSIDVETQQTRINSLLVVVEDVPCHTDRIISGHKPTATNCGKRFLLFVREQFLKGFTKCRRTELPAVFDDQSSQVCTLRVTQFQGVGSLPEKLAKLSTVGCRPRTFRLLCRGHGQGRRQQATGKQNGSDQPEGASHPQLLCHSSVNAEHVSHGIRASSLANQKDRSSNGTMSVAVSA